MTTAAVMVARDEADIVEATVRHTLAHVDEVIAADHLSVDGTRELLAGLPVALFSVAERGFRGDAIWTWLAREARARGHEWLLVVDADDIWHVAGHPAVRVGDYLAGLPASARVVSADSFNHVPTGADDPAESNPVVRVGWRRRDADALKVACRLRPDLRYAAHNAWYGGALRAPDVSRGLTVRHFTIRTADQLVRKVRNGLDAFSVEAGMPEGYDESWEQWKGLSDDEIRVRFHAEFYSADPEADGLLVHDPAPYAGPR